MKNLSEYALCFTTQDWLILHSKDINSGNSIEEKQQKIINNCHVYMIHTRPLVSFVADSILYEDDKKRLKGEVKANLVGGKIVESNFSLDFELLDGAVSVKCFPPYREITTHNSDNEVIRILPAYVMIGFLDNKDLVDSLLKLKIEYIGQAYGDGNRNSLDRLKSHKTFQKILSEIPYYHPDLEVFVSLVSFQDPRLITKIDGMGVDSYDKKIESKRLRSILTNPLTKKEQINLIEAGLIRYFQPNYNINLKQKFPSAKQQMLSKLSNLDISGMIVEFSASDLGFRIYTDTIPASDTHLAKYDLTTHEKRTSFFNRSINVCHPDELIKMTS